MSLLPVITIRLWILCNVCIWWMIHLRFGCACFYPSFAFWISLWISIHCLRFGLNRSRNLSLHCQRFLFLLRFWNLMLPLPAFWCCRYFRSDQVLVLVSVIFNFIFIMILNTQIWSRLLQIYEVCVVFIYFWICKLYSSILTQIRIPRVTLYAFYFVGDMVDRAISLWAPAFNRNSCLILCCR